jgi:hypothetical protein
MERIGEWTFVLLHEVKSAARLLDAVEAGRVKCDVVNAGLVLGKLQLCVAMQRLVSAPQIVTRTGTAPLIAGLAPKRSSALRTVGYSPACSRVLLALRDPSTTAVNEAVSLVDGAVVPLSLLGDGADAAAVAEAYGVAVQPPAELLRSVVNQLAVCDI